MRQSRAKSGEARPACCLFSEYLFRRLAGARAATGSLSLSGSGDRKRAANFRRGRGDEKTGARGLFFFAFYFRSLVVYRPYEEIPSVRDPPPFSKATLCVRLIYFRPRTRTFYRCAPALIANGVSDAATYWQRVSRDNTQVRKCCGMLLSVAFQSKANRYSL